MCIIVVKPSGNPLPTWATLQNCFNNNPDGAGFMYNDKGIVKIRKGFMDWNEFYKAFKEEKKTFDWENATVVFHFRIKTHGEVSRECCHPFPITRDLKRLRKTEVTTKYALAHNGVISGMKTDTRTSDTMAYIMSIVAPCVKMCDSIDDKNMESIITTTLGSSRLALLDGEGHLKLYGHFIEKDGIYFSNSTYVNYDSYYGWLAKPTTSPLYTQNKRTAWASKNYRYPKWDACKTCSWKSQCASYGAECADESEARDFSKVVNDADKNEVWVKRFDDAYGENPYTVKHASDYDYSGWSEWDY